MKAVAWAAVGSIATLAVIGIGAAGLMLGSSSLPPMPAPMQSAPIPRSTILPSPTPTVTVVSHRADCVGTWAYLTTPNSTKTSFGVTISADRASVVFADYSPGISGEPKVSDDGGVQFATSEGKIAMLDCDPGRRTATLIWDGSSFALKRLTGSFEAFATKHGLMGD